MHHMPIQRRTEEGRRRGGERRGQEWRNNLSFGPLRVDVIVIRSHLFRILPIPFGKTTHNDRPLSRARIPPTPTRLRSHPPVQVAPYPLYCPLLLPSARPS